MNRKHFPGSRAKKEFTFIFRHEIGMPIHGSNSLKRLLSIAKGYAEIPVPRGNGYIIEDKDGVLYRTENGSVRKVR